MKQHKSKPYSPFKTCKKCNSEFKHYNLSTTPCPRCEELKNELKNGRIEEHISKGLSGKYSKAPKSPTNGKIRSNYIGRNLRKLTSEPVPFQKRIPKVSKKQASINAEAEKIKKQIEHDRDPCCESCGCHYNLDPSHAIPVSKRKDLELDPEGIFVQCRSYMGRVGCHEKWEHQMLDCLKFKNLDKMLAYVKSKDEGRYLFIVNKLSEQLNYSR